MIKKLESNISPSHLKRLKEVYENKNNKNYHTLINEFSRLLADDEDVRKFEELISNPVFIKFLKKNINSSVKRFTLTASKIADLLSTSLNIKPVIRVLECLNLPQYRKALKTYFLSPVDFHLYDIFESEFFHIAENNPGLAEEYFIISDNFGLKDLKNCYFNQESLLLFLIEEVRRFLFIRESAEDTLIFIEFLTHDDITRLVGYYNTSDEDERNLLIQFLTGLIDITVKIPVNVLTLLRKLLNRTRRITFQKTKRSQRKFLLISMLKIFDAVLIEKTSDEYLKFIDYFPYLSRHPSRLLWTTLFESDKTLIPKYIRFFISTGFLNFMKHHNYENDVLEFLLKHVLVLLKGLDIDGFPASLMPVVLQLLINQKADRYFIKKRQNFSKWLSEKNSSAYLESYFIRIFLYEYVFINKEFFEKDPHITLTRYCDTFHQLFCEIIDDEINPYGKKEEREPLYQKLYSLARSKVWEPALKKYQEYTRELKELSTICESLDIDDIFLNEMKDIPPEYFPKYYIQIKHAVIYHPDETLNIIEKFQHDFCFRVYFRQVEMNIVRVLLPLIGNYDVIPDEENNLAYTDGHTIHLPSFIARFPDDPDTEEGNRNFSMYIALALHESGHILGGTFKFNFMPVMNKFEYSFLIKFIHNLVEDFRVEHYLIRIKAHPQIKGLMRFMNLCLSLKEIKNPVMMFLMYIYDKAYGITDEKYRIYPQTKDLDKSLFDMPLNCGRFRTTKNFAEYTVERLTHLDIANPLASFYLSEEIYKIIIHWPKESITQMEDYQNAFRSDKPAHDGKPVYSDKGLKKLYNEFNENPLSFFENHEIPVLSGSFGEANREKKGGESDGKTNNANSQVNGNALNQQITNLLIPQKIDYEAEGLFDISVHTKVDDESAKKQIEQTKKSNILSRLKEGFKPKKKKKTIVKKTKRIISLNKETDTRVLIKNCYEHEINAIDRGFLASGKKYDYISKNITQLIAQIIENQELETVDYSSIEGDISMERLIDLLIDKNNRINLDFLESQIESRNSLNAVIGLDISGSTATFADTDTATTILDIEKYFALIFSNSLKMIADEVNIYGFDSISSTNIYHAVPLEAVTSFSFGQANRDGDFIRYITDILSKKNQDLKYFFMISDGQPESVNYFGKHALDDTLLSMRECRQKGVRLFYFNIDVELRPYFNEFKREADYAEHFSHPEELIQAIPQLMLSLTNEII